MQTMMWGDGYGASRPDLYSLSLMAAQRSWHDQADKMADTTESFLMLGTYVWNHHGPRFYGEAINIARRLARADDAALTTHDVLLMPAAPTRATALPAPGADRATIITA